MVVDEKTKSSITDAIEIYRNELRSERTRLNHRITKTKCIVDALPLLERLSYIETELLALDQNNRFVGTPDEFEKVTEDPDDMDFWYGKKNR